MALPLALSIYVSSDPIIFNVFSKLCYILRPWTKNRQNILRRKVWAKQANTSSQKSTKYFTGTLLVVPCVYLSSWTYVRQYPGFPSSCASNTPSHPRTQRWMACLNTVSPIIAPERTAPPACAWGVEWSYYESRDDRVQRIRRSQVPRAVDRANAYRQYTNLHDNNRDMYTWKTRAITHEDVMENDYDAEKT